jgi:3-oxoacyl-[acyl-carrier-protein] synthase-1
MKLALVADDALEPLAGGAAARRFPSRQQRIVRLAGPALREAAAGAERGRPAALFLGLPEPEKEEVALAAGELMRALAEQSGRAIDEAASQVFPRGRAAALVALDAALRHLGAGRAESVIVGGADTFFDGKLLRRLDREGRVLGARSTDGFVPGEGAAFIELSAGRRASARSTGAFATITALGTATDSGHRYATAPARGEGLAHALDAMVASSGPPSRPIATAYGSMNGESFDAKQWGVARLRHSRTWDEDE